LSMQQLGMWDGYSVTCPCLKLMCWLVINDLSLVSNWHASMSLSGAKRRKKSDI
jgi:hypothetical protein